MPCTVQVDSPASTEESTWTRLWSRVHRCTRSCSVGLRHNTCTHVCARESTVCKTATCGVGTHPAPAPRWTACLHTRARARAPTCPHAAWRVRKYKCTCTWTRAAELSSPHADRSDPCSLHGQQHSWMQSGSWGLHWAHQRRDRGQESTDSPRPRQPYSLPEPRHGDGQAQVQAAAAAQAGLVESPFVAGSPGGQPGYPHWRGEDSALPAGATQIPLCSTPLRPCGHPRLHHISKA